MTLQNVSGYCVPAAKRAHSPIGRYRFASLALSAGVFAISVSISVSSFGSDLRTGYSTAIVVPPQAAPAGRRPNPAHPIDPPDAKPDRSIQRARIIDRLYEELMRSSGCSLASNNASIVGGC
jgi:hypothetical protein